MWGPRPSFDCGVRTRVRGHLLDPKESSWHKDMIYAHIKTTTDFLIKTKLSVYENRDNRPSMNLWGLALDLSFTWFRSIKQRIQEGIYLGSDRPEAKKTLHLVNGVFSWDSTQVILDYNSWVWMWLQRVCSPSPLFSDREASLFIVQGDNNMTDRKNVKQRWTNPNWGHAAGVSHLLGPPDVDIPKFGWRNKFRRRLVVPPSILLHAYTFGSSLIGCHTGWVGNCYMSHQSNDWMVWDAIPPLLPSYAYRCYHWSVKQDRGMTERISWSREHCVWDVLGHQTHGTIKHLSQMHASDTILLKDLDVKAWFPRLKLLGEVSPFTFNWPRQTEATTPCHHASWLGSRVRSIHMTLTWQAPSRHASVCDSVMRRCRASEARWPMPCVATWPGYYHQAR
jgi:hypothetical protein